MLGSLLIVLSGCGESADEKGGKQRRAPQVGFVVATQSTVPLAISLGARTAAFRTSEVRPQVNGLIRERTFVEGGTVRQGQPLFRIDPSLYQASVNEASANVAAARATAEAAQAKANRLRPLAEMEAVARQD